jgi:hypothetical protein
MDTQICGDRTSKHLKPNNTPYPHFQVRGLSESAPHKNGQSNICLSQVYEPRISRRDNTTIF